MSRKPLGHKSYGHIAHLPGSRMGLGDHKCHEGQKAIACDKLRDKYDRVIVQEKLDGSNVGVLLMGDEIVPLTRAGYRAETSPYIQHHYFASWVRENTNRFRAALLPGERICGEWMLLAHGTRYKLPHEPFVAFDLIHKKHDRLYFDAFIERTQAGCFITPKILSDGPPFSITEAMTTLGYFGFHGALEQVEGAVWRVERSRLNDRSLGNAGGRTPIVDFLVKYVRPDKEDGKYLYNGYIYNQHS